MRKVKFGIQALQGMPDYSTLKKVVQECDRLDFDSAWVYDHLQFTYGPTLECWTILAALAEATHGIRIGSLVTCNAFRYPSLLARMGATVDMISEGRLIFGIGAGWLETEAVAYGIPFARAGTRVEMLDEALSVIRKLWTEDEVTFKGKHYSLEKAVCLPKPVQKPYPPILVAGGGDKMLRVIAKHANAWNSGFTSPEDFKQEITRLEKACNETGRNRNEIENTFQSRVIIAENDEDAIERAEKWREERKGASDDPDWKFAIKGSPETCTNILKTYVDSGVTHFTLLFADAMKLEPLRLFADEVMPKFR
ncbi:MAG TPA: TIGR03560 family F420-dependent LLM class oxidoreductase [Candidatus Acidoferrum sp.]|jgi:F420-dependent oxidoreductase-like protein|nr:TIGR03560 family F420-dependent LLM class oxidoreductase [Candidatus Acidoferrum sp.]